MSDLPTEHSLPPGDDGRRIITLVWGGGQGRRGPTLLYLTALTGLVGALAFSVDVGSLTPVWVVVLLGVLAAVAERGSARVSGNNEISISLLPLVFAAVALGPMAALIVGVASMVTLPIPVMRWGVYTASRAATGVLTGMVVLLLPDVPGGTFAVIAVSTLAAATTAQLLDALFGSITVVLRGAQAAEVFSSVAPVMIVSAPLNATVTAPLAFVFSEFSPWSVLFFLAPAVVAQRLFLLYQEQRELASSLATANRRLERASLSFARSLVTALDARDHYTAGHSAAVAIYARDIAKKLGLTEADQSTAHLAGLLHDIGKVGLPPGILEKPGALTPEERLQLEEHSVIGERILRNVEDYAEIATAVRHHHERVDGQGYPDGLCRHETPVISRILCVADAYNAMTSGRPYRDAMSTPEARRRLVDGMGTQFDDEVMTAFERVLQSASDLYLLGASADFALEAQAHPELREQSLAQVA